MQKELERLYSKDTDERNCLQFNCRYPRNTENLEFVLSDHLCSDRDHFQH